MEKTNTTAGNEEKSARKLWFASAVFLMLLTLGLGIFLGSKKHVAFCDEPLSYSSANSVWKENIYERWNEWLSGEDVEAYYAATDINPRLITIMKKLWVDHVPFYYWLLRFASLIVHGSASPWIGLGLNLLFTFLFLLWAFAAVGKRVACERRVNAGILLFSLLFFLSSSLFFSELTMIRMYLLVSLFMFMFLWYACSFYLEEDAAEGKRRRHAGFVLVGACGLLTHYLFLPFYGILVFLLFWLILAKARKKLWPFIRMNLCTLILSCAMDPYWIYRFFRYNLLPRGSGDGTRNIEPLRILYRTVKKLAVEPFSDKLGFVPALLLSIVIIGAALYLMKKNSRKGLKGVFLLSVAADILYLCAVNVMSDGTGRYTWPALAVWMLLFYGALVYDLLALFCTLKGRLRLLTVLPAGIFVMILCFNILASTAPRGIDSLYAHSVEPVLEEEYSVVPWVAYCTEHSWCEEGAAYKYMIPERIAFLSKEHPAEKGFELPEELLLVTADWELEDALAYLEKLKGRPAVQREECVKWDYMGAYLLSFEEAEEE